MTPQNFCERDDSQDLLEIIGGTGYCNTLCLEETVPKVRQITAMKVDQKSPREQFRAVFHAQSCILLSFQSFLCARQRCVNEALFIQGPFDKIQGLLGKIQGLFKNLSKFFNF